MSGGRFLSVLVSIGILMAITTCSSATVYYVDSAAGSDSHSGTSSSAPWKTLAKVNSHSFAAGDQILLKRGSTWREQLNVRSSGSSSKPVVFGAYGSGNAPLINASDLVGHWSSAGGHIYRASISWSPSHVWYNGALLIKVSSYGALTAAKEWFYSSGTLYVWAPGSANPNGHAVEADHRSRAIDINSRSYITIDGIAMKNSTSSLVAGWNAPHIRVQNCTLKNAWIGVYVTAKSPDLIVSRCTMTVDSGYSARNFVLISSSSADGPVVANNVVGDLHGFVAIMFNDVNFAQAYGNTITGSGSGIEVAATTRSVTGAQIYNNAVFNSDHRLVDGESIKLRGTSHYTVTAKIYRNYVKGGPYTWDGIGGWYAVNSEIYGNIVMGSARYGMQFTNSNNNSFANNTLYNNPLAGISLYTRGSAQVKNNIIQGSATGISSDSSVKVSEDYNLFYKVAALRSVHISAGSHTKIQDPVFVVSYPKSSNDFKLSSHSPAIGAGTNLGSPYNMVMDPRSAVFPYAAVNENTYGSWERGSFIYR